MSLFGLRLIRGYPVRVRDALAILDGRNPAAAQWWRENAPLLVARNSLFLFEAAACEEVSDP